MIRIDGTALTTADIVAAARRDDVVELTEEARSRVGASAALAERIAAERPLYGRSTGVGANRNVSVDDPAGHARALLRSHATSAGPLRSPVRVRAMLVVRLNQLAAGGSGASPAVLDGLAAMLAADALPYVREHGSVGTSDLPALATTALALMGEAPTTFPLSTRVELGAADALPLMSSNAATIGDAALAGADLMELARASVVVAALTFAGVDGNREAFAELVERVTPFAGARQVCRWMRALTDGATAGGPDPGPVRAADAAPGARRHDRRAASTGRGRSAAGQRAVGEPGLLSKARTAATRSRTTAGSTRRTSRPPSMPRRSQWPSRRRSRWPASRS